MSLGQLSSALHSFGTLSAFKSKKIPKDSPFYMKKAQKNKIGVQPEAVKRRKFKNGSRKALKKSGATAPIINRLPEKQRATKRKHKFAVNVLQNDPAPKKAGRSMASRRKIPVKVKQENLVKKNEKKK